jgi:hypothetical protein
MFLSGEALFGFIVNTASPKHLVQRTDLLNWFGVYEGDWGSENPVEAAREFAKSFKGALG